MLIREGINEPVFDVIENPCDSRQCFPFGCIPWISVIDIGFSGHWSESKTSFFHLPAKNISSMKYDCMA